MFREQLTRKEAELTRVEETIRREQQQMRQQVHAKLCIYRIVGKLHEYSSELQNVREILCYLRLTSFPCTGGY